jgi:hypothetical protein
MANLLWFAWRVWFFLVPPQSPATWLMWFALDALLFVTTLLAGKPIWLPLSYVIGAGLIAIAMFVRGKWSWTYRETLCAIATAVATYYWLALGPDAGVFAGVVALTAAGVPVFLDMLRNPVRKTFPLWAITALGCICTLLGSDWTVTGTVLAWGGLLFNGFLAFYVLRDIGDYSF